MASTYTLISSNTLSTSASSVTFSSIPGTYTDLVLRVSGRTDDTANPSNNIRFFINGNTSAVYTFMRILSDGTTPTQYTAPIDTELYFGNAVTTSLSTSNTFGNAEIYIPSYTSSTEKPMGSMQATETNATAAYMGTVAGLVQISSAITTIEVQTNPTKSFITGSSFYLYGIKNS